MMIVTTSLELTDECRQSQPGKQREGKLESVVGMELDFRQEVAGGNAQKRACGKGERRPEKQGCRVGKMRGTEMKQHHARRDGQREQSVDNVTGIL